jgi:hypothetical protein
MSGSGPKLRLENVWFSLLLGGKQTFGELPQNDAHDPKETLTFELQDHDRRRHLLREISANAIQRVVCF